MSTDNADYRPKPPVVRTRADLDEQVRSRGLRPLRSAADLKGPEGVFESGEVDEFIEFIYAQRRADRA
jgi:hypothetical protein